MNGYLIIRRAIQFKPRRVKPAFFESDSAKQHWKLIEKGELDLEQSEFAMLQRTPVQQELEPQFLSKLTNLENLPSQVESLIHEVSSMSSGLKNLEQIVQKQQMPMQQGRQPQPVSKLANIEGFQENFAKLMERTIGDLQREFQTGLKNLEQIVQRQQPPMQQDLQPQFLSKLSNLENLSSQVELLIHEVSSMSSGLKNLEQIVQKQQTPMQQELQSQKTKNDLIKESPEQTLCRLYNAAVEDSNKHSEFMKYYQPTRIGVANAMERGRDSSKEPDFQTSPHGDYYAVVIEGDTHYAVVPRFDLTLQTYSYGPGAMGLVFECPNYDPQLRYRNMKVVKPAFFEPDSEKKRWTLIEKGELDLGQGE